MSLAALWLFGFNVTNNEIKGTICLSRQGWIQVFWGAGGGGVGCRFNHITVFTLRIRTDKPEVLSNVSKTKFPMKKLSLLNTCISHAMPATHMVYQKYKKCRWLSPQIMYVWYTICVDGMASDILSKEFSTSWNDEQAAPPDYSHHHSRKKSLTSESILWQSNSKAPIILWDYVL